MAEKDKVTIFKNVGGVDEDSHKLNGNPTTNLLNVESIHLQINNNLVENDELLLANITTQAHKWKPNNKNSMCWGFFAVNDNFLIGFKNPLKLQCIIYNPNPQEVGNTPN